PRVCSTLLGVFSRLHRGVGRVLPPVAPLDGWARWTILVVLAGGAVVRGAGGLFWAEPAGGDLIDPVLYSILADQIAHGHGFTYPGAHPGPTAYYPPGYPLALGAVLCNIVLAVATVWMVFELGRRLVGVPVGLIGAAVMALWPNAIVHTGL